MSGYSGTRKLVRDNLKSLLTNFTDAGANVFSFRASAAFPAELPCITIYTKDDVSKLSKKFEHCFKRDLQIFIEILVKKTSVDQIIEDTADIIAGQVENRILPNKFLQFPPPENIQSGSEGIPGSDILESIELIQIVEAKVPEGLVDVFGLVMEFRGTYEYEIYNGIVTPFETGDIQYDLAGAQNILDQAHDVIALPQ